MDEKHNLCGLSFFSDRSTNHAKSLLSWVLAILLIGHCFADISELEMAKNLIKKGNYANARRLLEPLVKRNPKDPKLNYLIGYVSLQLEDYGAAIPALQIASAAAPQDMVVLKQLAIAEILGGKQDQGANILKHLTELSPKDPDVWSLLGRVVREAGKFEEAVPLLEESLRLRPDDVMTLNALANAKFALGDLEGALANFLKSVANNSKSQKPAADPHASFAIFLLRLNRVPEAKDQLQRALAIDPNNSTAIEAHRALQLRLQSKMHSLQADRPSSVPMFTDIAIQAGLNYVLENSPTPSKHQIETMPGGVAVLDYNRDGWMDIYFTNGADSPSLLKTNPRFWNRLYQNNGDCTFTDVTARSGVQGVGYMMGAAAADFDNDSFTDLFVVGVDRNILYHNNGDGTFSDITCKAGLDHPDPRYGRQWGIHAAWLDYDNDGCLDLLVVNYCQWDPSNEPYCGDPQPGGRAYCHPGKYGPLPNQLFHNNRDGTFTDVSALSGIGKYLGKGMGASVADYDGDGWIDIFIANDTEPNFLFRNKASGTFEEIANQVGVAFNQFGNTVSSMGVDFKDLDNDGRPDLFVTDLSNEGFLLFRNRGNRFDDIADQANISLPSLPYGGWSNAIVDLDNDGWKDLFSANGHVLDNIRQIQSRPYRQRNLILQNKGNGCFHDISQHVGGDFQRAAAHRGAAVADFDNDGNMDIVVTALGSRPELFHNVTPAAGHWLLIQLTGSRSNRDGLGAVLRLESEDGRTLWNNASTSVGFASSSDSRIHFGLGRSSMVRCLEIHWPSGARQTLTGIKADQVLTIKEPAA